MLTWRYHLLSLVAVFLALGLGVLVGISLSDNGVVETGEASLVQDIQVDLEDLRTRNDLLENDRSINLRFQDDTLPFIISGRLQGRKIAIVSSSKVGDEIQRRLASAINGAGGQVVTTTILSPGMQQAALATKLKTAFTNDPLFAELDAAGAVPLAAQHMARELSGKAGPPKVLPALQGTLVESMSGNYQLPVDGVVLLTRADDEQSPDYTELEKRLLLGLRERGMQAVGAEPADAPRSEVPLFVSVDVSSVDNVESRMGQISVVFVLGGEKGAFGVKTTADMLIPILRAPKLTAQGPVS